MIEWTCYRGLATPALLDDALWIAETTHPGDHALLGVLLHENIDRLKILTTAGIITSQVHPDGRVYAAITARGLLALKLGLPARVYKALRTASNLLVARHIDANPGCQAADLYPYIASQSAARDAIKALYGADLLTRSRNYLARTRPWQLTLTATGRQLVAIAAGTPTVAGLR